ALPSAAPPLVASLAAARFAADWAADFLAAVLVVSPSWPTGGRRGAAWPSGSFLDAEHVARGVSEGTIPHAVGLIRRFLDHLGALGLQALEGAVDVRRGQDEAGVGALGHHLEDGAALFLGDAAAVHGDGVQDDGELRLTRRDHGDPAHAAVADVVADLESDDVAVKCQGGVGVGVREKTGVNG